MTSQSDDETQERYEFATNAIHIGQEGDPMSGSLITPIVPTATFVLEELTEDKRSKYGRAHNPTRNSLEECLAALDHAEYAVVASSGMAVISMILNLLSSGDHVIVGEDIYGGSYRLFEKVLKRFQLSFTYVDASDPKNVEEAFQENTKLVFVETPTNPLLRLADIEAISTICKKKKVLFTVDSTFASPYFQKPLDLGADLVVHSTTKYLGGHSDALGGVVVTRDKKLFEELKFLQNTIGSIPSPFDCWLILRGIKTLALRMREHDRNSLVIAQYLERHPAVEKVYFPGLPSHPQYNLAKRQMTGFGGVVSVLLHGGYDAARQMLNATKLFQLAESFGGVKSLICHPATMTTLSAMPKELRDKRGIVDGLIRLSVGIEDINDLLRDLEQAMPKVQNQESEAVLAFARHARY